MLLMFSPWALGRVELLPASLLVVFRTSRNIKNV